MAQTPDPWAGYRFVLGNWVGVGKGAPGEGSGWTSFESTLDGKALVRKNHAEYPAANGRPAVSHDDLLLLYLEGAAVKGLYVDNEGHVIHYDATSAPKTVTLTSVAVPKEPRYRFTYLLKDDGTVTARFEIAPPDAPTGFKTYVEGDIKKAPATK